MTPKTSPAPVMQEWFGQAPTAAALLELGALRQAVGHALDRKRRLGHYAVIWQGGAVRTVPPEALPALQAGKPGDGAQRGGATLMQTLSACEPLPEGWVNPADPPPQARDPL